MTGLLADVPRVPLGHLPTPFERLDRLSEALGGPEIWIKRDDCTGFATGGNKTRKLEFLLADALANGCDTLVTVGKLQSNHARQTAAAAANAGLRCVLLLERLDANDTEVYASNGNALLNRLLGAETVVLDSGSLSPELADQHLDRLRSEGSTPAYIPVGGSDGVGSLGYVACAVELTEQAAVAGVDVDHVVMATGSGGTQAGLVVGFGQLTGDVPVLGFSVSSDTAEQVDKVAVVADLCAARLGVDPPDRSRILVDDGALGPGYGRPDGSTIEAIELFARAEGIILDPVYTGKAAAGLVAGCRSGRFASGERVVFLHTGGQAGAFAYDGAL